MITYKKVVGKNPPGIDAQNIMKKIIFQAKKLVIC